MKEGVPDLIDCKTLDEEFSRLKDSCYLDHTGTALYAKSQVDAMAKDMIENLYSNPHSNSLASKLCNDSVDQIRYRVLQLFNTTISDYSLIFTSGATEALKIVAESFDFTGKLSETQNGTVANDDSITHCGEFVILQDNHTSVLGMRNVDNITLNRVPIRCLSQSEATSTFAKLVMEESNHEVPTIQPVIIEASEANSNADANHEVPIIPTTTGNSLFVFPAQSNFSGLKYPLSWVKKVQDGVLENKINQSSRQCKWFCLLDAATFVSTNYLDLSSLKPDFVTISFYKMFGLPTGLGALLVRNTSAAVLHKCYYGGGTVQMALSTRSTHVMRPVLHERFEDGTINFLSIIAVRHGLDWQEKTGLSVQAVSLHCFRLACYTHSQLLRLHHNNGQPAVSLYADTAYDDSGTQGAIVNFNMRRDTGQCVGFMEVLTMANLHGIHLRTGCFCNPGACQQHLGISDQEYYRNFQAGHVCGDDKDLIDGQPTGSVRVSFGPYSRQVDADRLLHMLTHCFVSKPPVYKVPENWENTAENLRRKLDCENQKEVKKQENNIIGGTTEDSGLLLGRDTKVILESNGISPKTSLRLEVSQICLYPIKSCGAMSVSRWPLDSRGLLYDRCWMVVSDSGVALTQKQEPRLCLIKPVVDLSQAVLRLTFQGYPSCSVPLTTSIQDSPAWLCHSKVCGDNVRGQDCGEAVAKWLSLVLKRPGLGLLRQSTSTERTARKKDQGGPPSSLALSNQAQFLLVNENSVAWLTDKLPQDSDCPKTNMVERFRSNFVLRGNCPAFDEQEWKNILIGSIKFKVDGPCGRCQMICIDQTSGERTKEPLTTLAANCQGSMKFGIYLSQDNPLGNSFVSVGDRVTPSLT